MVGLKRKREGVEREIWVPRKVNFGLMVVDAPFQNGFYSKFDSNLGERGGGGGEWVKAGDTLTNINHG